MSKGYGILGSDLSPQRPLTEAQLERKAANDHFDRVIEEGHKAVAARDAAEREVALDNFECNRLGPKYENHFDRRPKMRKIGKIVQRRYVAAAQQFHDHCAERGVSALPVKEGILSAYLDDLIEGGASPELIRIVVDAISYRHQLSDFFDPSKYLLVEAIVRSTQKAGAKLNGVNGHKPPTQTED
jgi:hypothetical protein